MKLSRKHLTFSQRNIYLWSFSFRFYGIRAQRVELWTLYNPPALNVVDSVTVKLTEKNYIIWKRQFEAFLNGQGLLGFVTGSAPPPVTTLNVPIITGQTTPVPNQHYQVWFQTDQVVQPWLLGSFTEDIQSVVLHCTSAQEIWAIVGKSFDDRLQSYTSSSTELSPHLAFNTTRSSNFTWFPSYRGRGSTKGLVLEEVSGRNSFSTRGRGFHQQLTSYKGSSASADQGNRPVCQICGRMGHVALRCWHRFNNSYQDDELPTALAAMRIYKISILKRILTYDNALNIFILRFRNGCKQRWLRPLWR